MVFILMIGASSLIAEESEGNLASEAQNPIANLISVPLQNNTRFNIGPHDRTRNILNIQPVVWQPDILTESGGSTGLGDLNFTAFYVPGSGEVTWGVGPVLAFPTGGCDRGTEKWSVGASGVIVATPSPWVVGLLINNVWSVAGADDRSVITSLRSSSHRPRS